VDCVIFLGSRSCCVKTNILSFYYDALRFYARKFDGDNNRGTDVFDLWYERVKKDKLFVL
jgi:hypothetical protein